MLFERTGRIAKTHSGLRTALAQVLDRRSEADRGLLTFLARACKYKELGDYAVGRAAAVNNADAAELIQIAGRLLATVTERLDGLDEDRRARPVGSRGRAPEVPPPLA